MLMLCACLWARQLRRESKRMKKVKLVPFMLVCGNHMLHDIAGEYSDSLRELGFESEVLKRGLKGEEWR